MSGSIRPLHILIEADAGKSVKVDQVRDRRLFPGEYERIVDVLSGCKREDRERPLELPEGEALLDLFNVILHTALRLREGYRLTVQDVRLPLKTLHIPRSKTGAARDVPIVPEIYSVLARRVEQGKKRGPQAPVFPWWSGREDQNELGKITALLSRAFGRAFDYASCDDLREHDLRHEATCRWVLMRDGAGGWMFRTEEVMRITGHKDPRQFMRYVSLRGSDLAERLWVS